MEDVQAAVNARAQQDGKIFEGRRMVVQHAIARPPTNERGPRRKPLPERPAHPPSNTLFIGNISYDITDKDLNDLFANVKDVGDVRVAIDRRTGQPRGFAHAEFHSVEAAEAAAEYLKTKTFNGRTLRIDFSSSNK